MVLFNEMETGETGLGRKARALLQSVKLGT